MTTVTEETTPSVVPWEEVVRKLKLDRLPLTDLEEYRRFYDAQVLIVHGQYDRATQILDDLERNGRFDGKADRIIELVRGKNR